MKSGGLLYRDCNRLNSWINAATSELLLTDNRVDNLDVMSRRISEKQGIPREIKRLFTDNRVKIIDLCAY